MSEISDQDKLESELAHDPINKSIFLRRKLVDDFGECESSIESKVYNAISPKWLSNFLTSLGYEVEFGVDTKNQPLIRTNLTGQICRFFFYGEKLDHKLVNKNDTLFYSFTIVAYFGCHSVSPENLIFWNSNRRHMRAFYLSDNDLCLATDIRFRGGVTQEYIIDSLEWFKSRLALFNEFINDCTREEVACVN